MDFDFFENSKKIKISQIKVELIDSFKLGDITLVPCYLNNGKTILISYRYETQFEGFSIKTGNKGFFYFPNKRILWNRETGKKYYSIRSIEEAVKKSVNLYYQSI